MKLRLTVTAILATVTLAGCAQKSSEIAASHVPSGTYQGYSCQQMQAEAVSLTSKARALGAAQDKKAGNDAAMTAVSLILFWPAAFFISGDGANTVELAEVKGRVDALNTAAAAKGCNLQ